MNDKRGFTIVEIVLFVVVISVALIPLLSVFGNVLHSSAGHHSVRVAAFLSQGLMEEVTGRNFYDIESFSLQEGELSERHKDFTAEVEVLYVQPEDFNLPAADETDFKRIKVSVSWRDGTTELVTVMAGK